MSLRRPLKPAPHQKAAIAAAVAGLRKHKRGQVIMACGTGKTLVGVLTAERMEARTLLVFVPSLLLARQLLNDYRRQWPTAAYLAVCSDIDRVASEDAPDAGDVGCETTTAPAAVAKFLRGPGRRVVIATYQSARVLAEMKFGGAVFDEAHRTAGAQGKPFAFGLRDENIRCGWRLFMTATPRHAKLVSEEGDTQEVYAMDDPAVYGPELYRMSLRDAVDRGLIVDYRIAVSVFNTHRRPSVVAHQIAVRRAMSRYNAKKVFTFHNTVAAAENFIESAHALRNVTLVHINGTQPNADRAVLLRAFAESKQSIVSNCRCLTEGVDLPACDMVVFMDPKESVVEIVQAVGRALRVSPRKKRAVIFLPICVNEKDGETLEEATKRTNFDKLHQVLQALQEQDGALAAHLNTLREDATTKSVIAVDGDFRGATKAVTERIRKYVAVRMLRPFRRYTRTEKAEILVKLARAGSPLPSHKRTRSLRMFFDAIRASGEAPAELLKTLRPEWFRSSPRALQDRKSDLLKRAGAGHTFSGVELKRLRTYASPVHQGNGYDRVFAAQLASTNPTLFRQVTSAPGAVAKAEIVALAQSGADRPPRGSFLWNATLRLRRSDRATYERLVRMVPHWFETRHARKIRVLLEHAKTRLPKPRPKTALYEVFSRRDKKLDRALRSLAPQWFQTEADIKKREILAMATAGHPKLDERSSDKKERALANALKHYRHVNGSSYDPAFARKIRQVAPADWFQSRLSKATNEGRVLLERLADQGGPRPTGALYNLLGRLTWTSQKGFDQAWALKMLRRAPHWFSARHKEQIKKSARMRRTVRT